MGDRLASAFVCRSGCHWFFVISRHSLGFWRGVGAGGLERFWAQLAKPASGYAGAHRHAAGAGGLRRGPLDLAKSSRAKGVETARPAFPLPVAHGGNAY